MAKQIKSAMATAFLKELEFEQKIDLKNREKKKCFQKKF
jgi:hypothetical protein